MGDANHREILQKEVANAKLQVNLTRETFLTLSRESLLGLYAASTDFVPFFKT